MKKYLLPLNLEFQQSADPDRARQMKAYLKDQFDFFGITSPVRKELIKGYWREYGPPPASEKEEIMRWCWQQPQREWQYFAMDALGRTVRKETAQILPLYEYMIVHKSWWDTIDFIAVNLVGPYFQKFPEEIPAVTRRWMDSDNIWLQRSCLLFQLKYKTALDTNLLESFIQPLASSKEFFIRKAIGWILREYSKTDPDYVVNFVETHDLSGLSHREALKWLNRKKAGNME